jgi:integrase
MVDYVSAHKVTTLGSYLSAVTDWYKRNTLGALPRDHDLVIAVRKGLLNYYSLSETTTPKRPIGFVELAQLAELINVNTFIGAREWASYILSFFGLLRRSEILDIRLKFSHIVVHNKGISITIPYSKTNLQPHVVHLCSRDDYLCPSLAFIQYRSFISPQLLSIKSCPAFLSNHNTTQVVDHRSMSRTLKDRLTAIGLDASHYGWHSWRRGGTTAMFAAGVAETLIQSHGRWASLTYRMYLDTTVSLEHSLLPTESLRPARP